MKVTWEANKQSNTFYDNFWLSDDSETIETYTYDLKDAKFEAEDDPDDS